MADVVTSSICAIDYKSDRCSLSIESWNLGSLLVNSVVSTAQTSRRSRRLIARSGVDHYRLRLCKADGTVARVGGKDFRLAKGDVVLCDLGMEFETRIGTGDMIFVYVPRDVLIPLLPAAARQDLHGLHFQAGTVVGDLLAAQIMTLRALLSRMTANDIALVSRSMLDVLVNSIVSLQGNENRAGRGFPAILATQIKSFIIEHLADPELGADQIMRRFRLSRTPLYELFRSHSGVSNYILTLRLRRCLWDLTDVRQRDRRIGQIAFGWGFNNESHFSRVFRDAFGMSPREARNGCSLPLNPMLGMKEGDYSTGQDAVWTMDIWKRHLGNPAA